MSFPGCSSFRRGTHSSFCVLGFVFEAGASPGLPIDDLGSREWVWG